MLNNKIKIDEYRGFTVYLDTVQNNFYGLSDEKEIDNTAKTYSGLLKKIDDFYKENENFKHFEVELRPTIFDTHKKYAVVGITKLNKFILADEKGDKKQIYDFNEGDYYLVNSANDEFYKEIYQINSEIKSLEAKRKLIEGKLTKTTLEDYKKQILNK